MALWQAQACYYFLFEKGHSCYLSNFAFDLRCKPMNLNQLKLFYLAVKYKSLSQAAMELNISLPAVSKGIQRLQEYYEVSLVHMRSLSFF